MEIHIENFNRKEVLQYLQWRGNEIPADVDAMIDRSITDTLNVCTPKYIWKQFSLGKKEELTIPELDLTLPGENIREMLQDCDSCIFMAATLGNGIERQIKMAQARDLSRAIVLDCCGSSAIEAVCDAVEEEIAAALPEPVYFTDRFSPGYGDFPLSFQHDLIRILDTSRQIGLTLTDSCILLPRKSVTAVIGLADKPQTKRFRGCSYCSMFEQCRYRKAGKYCGKQ